MCRLLVEKTISPQAPTVGGFLSHFRPLQLRGLFAFPILRLTELLRKLFFRIITSGESHLGQNRQFCTGANGGRISARFQPDAITRDFRFSNFTALRNFCQNDFLNPRFQRVSSWPERQFRTSADGGRISVRFTPATTTRALRFSNFTELLPKLFSESPRPTSRILVETTISHKRQRWEDFCQLSPATITRDFRVSDFTVLRNVCQRYFPESSLPTSRILARTTILHKRQRRADFCQISPRYNYEIFFAFPILRLYGAFVETIF